MMNSSSSGKSDGSTSKLSEDSKQSSTSTFSIATPAVTTILAMTGDYNDNSYMHSLNAYQQEVTVETSTDDITKVAGQVAFIAKDNVTNDPKNPNIDGKPKSSSTGQNESSNSNREDTCVNLPTQPQDAESKLMRKKDKVSKKSAKLDAKSKLEKSRQSARECRARKKLRYQYLEDLVCNREKAVVKLREELVMFCDLSKRLGTGVLTEMDKKLLSEQVKENS